LIFNGLTIWHTSLIAASAVLTLLALHFLYRNYTKVIVPTLLFWQTVTQNTMYNRLWKKFRQLLTFIFLAVILLLLAFSTARPFLTPMDKNVRYVLILDCRASMSIADEGFGQSRLERAKELCEKFLKDRSEFDKTMLLTAGQNADVLKGFDDSQAAAIHLLQNIKPSGVLDGDSVWQALEIAQSSFNSLSQAHIMVFTDHPAELENLPSKIKQNLTLVNLAAVPVANAAILSAQIMPADGNSVKLNIAIGYWGENNIEGELELYTDRTLLQKQSVELIANTIGQYSFVVSTAAEQNLSAKLVCNDKFQADNSIAVRKPAVRKIYIDANAPAALRFYIEADPLCQITQNTNDADLSISVLSGGVQIASAIKIIPTSQLYTDESKRNSVSSELFALGGSSLNNLPAGTVPLLTTEDGRILTALLENELIIADGLFAEQSTFWKQPQFPELMSRLIETAAKEKDDSTNTADQTAYSAYANLWNINTTADAQLPADLQQKPLALYRYLIIAALILLGFEGYAFYKGVIV
jgi:hypothetical protein